VKHAVIESPVLTVPFSDPQSGAARPRFSHAALLPRAPRGVARRARWVVDTGGDFA
jgi:hypothetical protein